MKGCMPPLLVACPPHPMCPSHAPPLPVTSPHAHPVPGHVRPCLQGFLFARRGPCTWQQLCSSGTTSPALCLHMDGGRGGGCKWRGPHLSINRSLGPKGGGGGCPLAACLHEQVWWQGLEEGGGIPYLHHPVLSVCAEGEGVCKL